jgi:hypothetical protein
MYGLKIYLQMLTLFIIFLVKEYNACYAECLFFNGGKHCILSIYTVAPYLYYGYVIMAQVSMWYW